MSKHFNHIPKRKIGSSETIAFWHADRANLWQSFALRLKRRRLTMTMDRLILFAAALTLLGLAVS